MKKKDVRTKSDFLRRWQKGEFGNRLRVWENINEIDCPLVGIRYKIQESKFMVYGVARSDVAERVSAMVSQGASRELFYFGEAAPDEDLILQGELQQSVGHYDLCYSTVKDRMRVAMKHQQYCSGLQVVHTLRNHCTEGSYHDLMQLLEDYPDHIVEFSVYRYCLGDTPGRNTLIWEVRKY